MVLIITTPSSRVSLDLRATRRYAHAMPTVPAGTRVCSSCGVPLAAGFQFCPGCGKPVPAIAKVARPRARLSTIARDGSASAVYDLVKDETTLGKDAQISLPDLYLAPLHARFVFKDGQLIFADAGALNGIYVQVPAQTDVPLAPNDEIRVGRQLLRVAEMPPYPDVEAQPTQGSPDPGYVARLEQILEGGELGDAFPLRDGDNTLGRTAADIHFPTDGYVSSRHAVVKLSAGTVSIRDLGSANGTFLRVRGEAAVKAGDLLLVGEQLLRVEPA